MGEIDLSLEGEMQSAPRVTSDPLASARQLSDEDLVDRIRAGDTSLFELLMRRHNQRLYRVARSILRDDAEVEDVLQEAYVRAFAHLDQFVGRSRFATWLTRIAVHEALHRCRRRRRFAAFDTVADVVESAAPGPEASTFHGELRQVLETSIDHIPEHFRTVFVLREVEGLSTEETAACLSIPQETVKTRLHRARQQLRDQLDRALDSALHDAFGFGHERCDRLVAAVLERIAERGSDSSEGPSSAAD
jgi:RNA polymerase sigma-70 factor (ECF subfamily)